MAKLGWQKTQSVLVPLQCIQADGGAVPRTLLLVQRKYPTMVRERLPSGVVITRTPEGYRAAQSRYETFAANVSLVCASQCLTLSPAVVLHAPLA